MHRDEKAEAYRLRVLRSMTPERRLLQAFELSERTRETFREGLRRRFPTLSEAEFKKLFVERLHACHNRNY